MIPLVPTGKMLVGYCSRCAGMCLTPTIWDGEGDAPITCAKCGSVKSSSESYDDVPTITMPEAVPDQASNEAPTTQIQMTEPEV